MASQKGEVEGEVDKKLSSEWQFTTSKLPENHELMATISNGFLGHRILSDTIYAAGVFNGNHLNSHRARIPSSVPTQMTVIAHKDLAVTEERLYTLDVKNAVFIQTITANDKSYEITQTTYAHRLYKNLLVTEVKAKTSREGGISVRMQSNAGKASADISFTSQKFKGISLNNLTNVVTDQGNKGARQGNRKSRPTTKFTCHVLDQ